ncbi:endo-1,4-beta-xylanase [Amphibacillus marinus]|uniref:Beta-xylanase n=1 Tax=Amphibacillus marinus TaxID=872970 RepID=A0A1H8IND6_9BACI|nr:endo-1,4-beta-xylanase [Amphibacillus marinus]SEN70094.1 endo-1,4-beta-xylanase [Amphibacillus marinus]
MLRNKTKPSLIYLLIVLLVLPNGLKPLLKLQAQDQTSQFTTIFQEDFATELESVSHSGEANLERVKREDNSGSEQYALHVSNRSANWHGVDLRFSSIGLEDGATYKITVNGFIDADEHTDPGALVLVQNIESYQGLYLNAPMEQGKPFTLTGTYQADFSKDEAIRIQSNDVGREVSFNLTEIVIEQDNSVDNETENPVDQHPPAESFKIIDFEDGELQGFEPRGSSEHLTVTDEANYTEDGQYALKVEGRSNTWHGPSLRVEPFINLGKEYQISAWIKLISPESSQLQLSTQIGSGDGASYNTIDSKVITSEDGWVKFAGTYRYNSIGNEYVTIYIESANNSQASFYIDDIVFTETDADEIELETDLQPLKEVYADYFLIGNAVSISDLVGQRLDLLNMHHNLVTAENAMKPSYAYNTARQFDFQAQDELVNLIQQQDLALHGHVLIWHQQTAEWLHTSDDGLVLSREEALANLRKHVKTTVEHFGEQVISWDVVNEAMNDNPANPADWRASLRQSGWYQAIGADYIKEAFIAAQEVINENNWDISLYYNDYNDDNQNKAEAIYQMVKEINQEYAKEHNGEQLIDGIGMQGHYNLNTNPENVRLSLEKFISLGVEVGVTELDVTAGGEHAPTERELQAQAYLYARLFQLYREHAAHISRVTFWGLNDATSWRSAQNPLLFDRNLQAKPAYYAVIDPDRFIEEHEADEQEANLDYALYGTPKFGAELDSVWFDAPVLPINRYQMAWQGASGTARVLWDEAYLYVLFQVSDSELDASSENAWEHDSVEVFVDENNEKTSFYQADDGQYRVNFLNEATFNPAELEASFESLTHVNEDGNGYTVQMKMPFRTIEPVADQIIGFDLQINDGHNGSRQSIATWNDLSGQGFQDTSVFGHLKLLQDSENQDLYVTINENEQTPVFPSQTITVRGYHFTLALPADLPPHTTITINVLDQLDNPISAQGLPLIKRGDVIDVKLELPTGYEAYQGEFILTLDIDSLAKSPVIYYLNEQMNQWQFKGGVIDPTSDTISLEVPSFSSYGVFELNVDQIVADLETRLEQLIKLVAQFERHGGAITELSQQIEEFKQEVNQLIEQDEQLSHLLATLLNQVANLEERLTEELNKVTPVDPNEAQRDELETSTPKSTDSVVAGQDGERLPDTATTLYNWLFLGSAIMLLGIASYRYQSKKSKRVEIE